MDNKEMISTIKRERDSLADRKGSDYSGVEALDKALGYLESCFEDVCITEVKSEPVDMVNRPPHYASGNIECIDAMKEVLGTEGLFNYCMGNVFKYIWRCKMKGKTLEDLEKARWYLNKSIELMGGKKDE